MKPLFVLTLALLLAIAGCATPTSTQIEERFSEAYQVYWHSVEVEALGLAPHLTEQIDFRIRIMEILYTLESLQLSYLLDKAPTRIYMSHGDGIYCDLSNEDIASLMANPFYHSVQTQFDDMLASWCDYPHRKEASQAIVQASHLPRIQAAYSNRIDSLNVLIKDIKQFRGE